MIAAKKKPYLLLALMFFLSISTYSEKKPSITIHSPLKNKLWHGVLPIDIELKNMPIDSVMKVEFYIDGKLVKEFKRPPYKTTYNFGSRIKYRNLKVVVKGIKSLLQSKTIYSLDADDYQEVNVSQILIPVVVMDSGNNYIKTLEKEDFSVIIDNEEKKISHFSQSGTSQFHMILLIDISSSMKDKIGAVKEAAKYFLNQLLTEENRAMIVFFNNEVFEDTDFTNDINTLNHSIHMVQPFGATALYDAIAYCYKLLKGISGHNIIIVFSDGEDNSSHMDPYTLLKKVEKSNNIVYSIGNEMAHTAVQYQVILTKIASISGGITFMLNDINKIRKVYEEIHRDIKAQYLLCCSIGSKKRRKRFHKISVKLKKKRYKIRTIKGFYY